MSMERKLRDAGVNVDRSRLATETYEALRRVKHDTVRASHIVMQAVLSDVRLLNELLGQNVRTLVEQYVAARAQDMKGLAGGGSRCMADSQSEHDPTPATDLRGASQARSESHVSNDRPRTPLPDASQLTNDSQRLADRSGTPSRESGASQRLTASHPTHDRPAPVNPGLKAAARSFLMTAADYQIPGVPGRRLGSITRHDRMNLSINSAYIRAVDAAIAKREVSGQIAWTDMTTPLEKVAAPSVLAEIKDEIEQAKEQAIQSVRVLTHGQ